MYELKHRRIRHYDEQHVEGLTEHPRLSYGTMIAAWVAGGLAAGGLLGSMYGANKQANATADATQANIEAQRESERQNWLRYLMARGINPGPNTQGGEVPGVAPGAAMNSKLPLWANVVNVRSGPLIVKKGTVPPATMRLVAPGTGSTYAGGSGGGVAYGGGEPPAPMYSGGGYVDRSIPEYRPSPGIPYIGSNPNMTPPSVYPY